MQHNIIQIFKGVLSYLPVKSRKHFFLLVAGMVLAACIETVALGVVAFFVASVSDPEAILHSSYIHHLRRLWDAHFLQDTRGVMAFLCILVVLFITVKNVARGIIAYVSRRYSAFVGSYIGEKMLTGYLYAPYEWHISRNSADITLSILWRTFFVNFMGSMLQVICDILVIVILLAALLIVEPLVSLIVIGSIGLSALAIFSRIKVVLDRTIQKVTDFRKSINREVTKGIHGIKDVKIYNRQENFITNYSDNAYTEEKLDSLQFVLGQSPQWILEAIGFTMLTLAIYSMYFFMEASTVRVTGIVALLAVAAWRVLPAVSKILNGLTMARSALPYVQNGIDYLSEVKDSSIAPSSNQGSQDFSFRQAVNFENVCFAYKGSDDAVLKEIGLIVEKGQTTGIIGVSGSGKSTLVDLLIGLLVPARGCITVDGRLLDNTISASWLRNIGYVAQMPYICEGTIAENVAFGLPAAEINREKVLISCEMAAMGDFLSDLPGGIDTQIGERGIKLSGGQRQRVAIARALYHDPEILIFDEATSSLDAQSEKAIQDTIYSFKGKQTLLIIAHRLSTVEHCDQIIWIDKGYIRKAGSPSDVLPEYRIHLNSENRKRFRRAPEDELREAGMAGVD